MNTAVQGSVYHDCVCFKAACAAVNVLSYGISRHVDFKAACAAVNSLLKFTQTQVVFKAACAAVNLTVIVAVGVRSTYFKAACAAVNTPVIVSKIKATWEFSKLPVRQ